MQRSCGFDGQRASGSRRPLLFLSPEWVRVVTRTIQAARRTDEYFRKLSVDYSLRLDYHIRELPGPLRSLWAGSWEARIRLELERGKVRKLAVGDFPLEEAPDFMVTSNYRTARQLFEGTLTPTSAFARRLVRIEPLESVYHRPRFTARTIIMANVMLRHARQVPTAFVEDKELDEAAVQRLAQAEC